MVAEFASAARVSERTIQRQMADAADLCSRFAATVDALREGSIARAHVSVIHDAGAAIDDDEARGDFETTVLRVAAELTPGRLRPIAEALAARLNPRSIDVRRADARARRCVRVVDLPDGMAEIIATLPATLARGIHDRLTQQAHAVIAARPDAGDGDTDDGPIRDSRSVDELRADILSDTLLTATPAACSEGDGLSAIRAIVQVTVPVLTLAGRSDEPAVVPGHGPIDGDTARLLAGGADGWERVMTSPVDGSVLAVDRYRPDARLQRFLRARDENCRFPGCRMPVWRCDLDHTVDAALGGPTRESNLEHLCQGHHTLKHASEWTVRQRGGGVLEWRSPAGRAYVDRPTPTLRFVPDPASPWRDAGPDDPIRTFRAQGDPPPF